MSVKHDTFRNDRIGTAPSEWQDIKTGSLYVIIQKKELADLRAALRKHHEDIGVQVHDPRPCSICEIDA